jgi:hypothetical protein
MPEPIVYILVTKLSFLSRLDLKVAKIKEQTKFVIGNKPVRLVEDNPVGSKRPRTYLSKAAYRI